MVEIISIHAPSRERHFMEHAQSCLAVFQSTLPHGSDEIASKSKSLQRFQSTLPHGSDQRLGMKGANLVTISIHAPSRERRAILPTYSTNQQISIHAPSRERLTALSEAYLLYNFNPRSLTGATCSQKQARFAQVISIHAPSRERLPNHRRTFL